MKRFFVETYIRNLLWCVSGFISVLSLLLGFFVKNSFFYLLFGALFLMFISFLFFINRLYFGESEIVISDMFKKTRYSKTDLKEIYLSFGGRGKHKFDSSFIALCFFEESHADICLTLEQYGEQCKKNPLIKMHAVDYNKKLLSVLLTDFNGKFIHP